MSLVVSAAATIADVERRREQAENFLSTLLGQKSGARRAFQKAG